MSELFIEIQEDIRRERFEKLWRSFGRVMVGVSVGIVLMTIVLVVVQDKRHEDAMQKTGQLLKGIDRINLEDYKGAVPIFSALTDDPSSRYYGIAMLHKAGVQSLSGDAEGAAKTYAALAEKDSDFAGLSQLHMPSTDDGKALDITAPFYHSLTEAKAWRLLEEGKKKEAVQQFLALAQDVQTPSSLKLRAQTVLQHIAPESLASPIAKTSSQEAKADAK
jgi:hypothetical protein